MEQGASRSLNYTYNPNNLPLSEEIGDEYGYYTVTRTYDKEGKIETLQFPDGSFVKYSYEGPFVKSISRFDGEKRELYNYRAASRDLMGNILEEILPGVVGKRSQLWDHVGRRLEISTELFQDRVREDGYDSLENINKRETIVNGEMYNTDYNYNFLAQLITERGAIDHNYSYDSIGNRQQRDNSSYHVNELNQLVEAEGSTYTFDLSGNIATKTTSGGTWVYTSNALNQLVSIKDPQGTLITYAYDLTGRRLSKRIESTGKKAKIFRFFYLDDTEIGCVDEKGGVVELKIPSNPNHPEAPCIAIETKNKAFVPLYDLQGNVACLIDQKRNKIVESYQYSVYGEEKITNERGKVIPDSSVGNSWRYRGKRIEKETGLMYFGKRYYDPQVGRWISADPAGSIDGPNLYAYARNNPMTYVDYFGLAADINENQSCACGFCERDQNICHCLNGIDYPSCVCKGISCNHKSGRRVLKLGNKIVSSMCGMGHAVVDFTIGSLHDLQTAAAYIGSDGLDGSVYERIQMLEAVEQSQVCQMAAVETTLMDLMGIDPSDTIYQNVRYGTRMGLEIGSLAAGGYGLAKGAIGFSKLARMPSQIVKASKTLGYSVKLNRFHQAARNLSEAGQNNVRVLRGWAKSKGWKKLPNSNGGPEKWGAYQNGKFEWRLVIKPEASFRIGLEAGSNVSRFDARLLTDRTGQSYINPFTAEIGSWRVGTHLPLEP